MNPVSVCDTPFPQSVGDSDARATRLDNLTSARQYISDKIQLLDKERLKKVPQQSES